MKKRMEGRNPYACKQAMRLALVFVAVLGCWTEDDALREWKATSDFQNPEELEPDPQGVYPLSVGPTEVTIDGKRYCLRSYNGKLTAPTLRVRAASGKRQVRLDFANKFQTEALKPVGSSSHHPHLVDFNTTNLHTHGLHVNPGVVAGTELQGDNVSLRIRPKQQPVSYRFDVDEYEPHDPGTFWYHAHVHGSTAIQVANGMAGAIIIEGAVDQLPGIREAKERIFVFQQIPYDAEDPKEGDQVKPLADWERCTESNLSINDFKWATMAKRTLINGIPRPRLTLPPGQVERWRFIHAGVSEQLKISVYEADGESCAKLGDLRTDVMQQIAEDGITFSRKQQRGHVLMAPGYRMDMMVKAPAEEGLYCLVDGESPVLDSLQTQATASEKSKLLAVLRVDKNAGPPTGGMPSDEDLARVAKPIDAAFCDESVDMPIQPVAFSQQKDAGGNDCPSFNINCKQYDENVVRTLVLGRTEEWRVSSGKGSHPFHIHVNPFVVCPGTVNGEEFQTPRWKDTLYISDTDGQVRLRTTFKSFTGHFVMHCHLLHHEDQGMMEAVQIVAP